MNKKIKWTENIIVKVLDFFQKNLKLIIKRQQLSPSHLFLKTGAIDKAQYEMSLMG